MTLKPFQRVAIVGFGEVGGIFGCDLAGRGIDVSIYDILLHSPVAREAMLLKARECQVQARETLRDCLREAELVPHRRSPGASPPAALADTHSIRVQATVMRHASIRAFRAPLQVSVTAADVARGYVEPAQPVEVEIRTNNPGGVMLGFNVNSPQVSGARFEGEDLQLSVAAGAAVVLVPKTGVGLRSQTLRLRTRLMLAPGAKPGVIAWPVALFIAPS